MAQAMGPAQTIRMAMVMAVALAISAVFGISSLICLSRLFAKAILRQLLLPINPKLRHLWFFRASDCER